MYADEGTGSVHSLQATFQRRIADGLSFGLTSYALLQLLTGRARRQDWMLYLLATLFLLRFIYLVRK